MIVAWVALSLIGIVEIFFAILLNDWRGSLGYQQERIDRGRRECYACITEASVMSFKDPDVSHFCHEHYAHWQLIHDLESNA